MPRLVAGVDISLRSTGLAYIDLDTGDLELAAVRTSGRATDRLPENLGRIIDMGLSIAGHIVSRAPEMVVFESALFNTAEKDTSAHRRAGLWWSVAQHLHAAGLSMTEVSPAELKKFTTGNGAAAKTAMLHCLDHDWPGHGAAGTSKYDMADAAYLAAMGAYGMDGHLPDRLGANAYRTATVERAMEHRTLQEETS